MPDVLLIDGGKGQVAQAQAVLAELGIESLRMVGVAKGPERRPGEETLWLPEQGIEIKPGAASPAIQLIQQIRDEAHRFAITGHRGRREKARQTSRLEEIPGIGARKRSALLKQFGGWGGVAAAGIEELMRVKGVSRELAERIAKIMDIPFDQLVEMAPGRYGEDQRYWLDSSAIKRDTGWEPRIGLDEGLAEMVEWGRRHIEQLKLAPTEYTLYA